MSVARRPSLMDEMTSAAAEVTALRELVGQARQRNRPAAERLVREHDAWLRSVIYGLVGRADAVDDLAQRVWAQAWQRLDSLEDPRRLRPWLYAIARNAVIDVGLSERRRAMASLDGLDPSCLAGGRAPPGTLAQSELRETLLRAVESLPAIYREPFVLRHLEDWSYAQIGELLGLPVETVETRLVRARRLLREFLRGQLEP